MALSIGVVVLSAGSATANSFGDPWNESNFQRYWYEDSSLNADWQGQMNTIRINQINPTHMYTETRSAHDNSDVAVYKRDLTNGIVGETTCIDDSSGGSICNHWHVRFNSDYDPWTTSEKRHIACHEFGHTLGLHHYPDDSTTDSCMKVPDSHHYSDHDVFHINDYYPNKP